MKVDDMDKDILRLLKSDGRMSFTDIAEEVGVSRVAVMKRVRKLEEEGVIRGYTTITHHEGTVHMFLEIYTNTEDYEDLLEYLNRTGYVKHIYIMTGANHIHASASAPEVSELKYLTNMVRKTFADKIKRIEAHGVKEVVMDKYGGVEYDNTGRKRNKGNE